MAIAAETAEEELVVVSVEEPAMPPTPIRHQPPRRIRDRLRRHPHRIQVHRHPRLVRLSVAHRRTEP